MKPIRPTIRPLPYYTTPTGLDERALAQSLRVDFKAKLARRLPGHHLVGFKQDTIIRYIQRYKKQYPYFFRSDIRQFYPSIGHTPLVVGLQVAYRDLIGMDYV